jgi:hypothetical protein
MKYEAENSSSSDEENRRDEFEDGKQAVNKIITHYYSCNNTLKL